MRCEDFPCCGHEMGCCPDFDSETGAQLNMVCVCGAKVPVDSSYSLCSYCLTHDEDGRPTNGEEEDSEEDFDDDDDDFDEDEFEDDGFRMGESPYLEDA